MSYPIPETGQENEIVRLHPISWEGSVAFILELQRTLAVRTLIINDAFCMPANLLVDSMVQWVRHYIIATHFNHYQRISYDLGAYSPAKGRALLGEEVPEVFLHIARHLARPRILIDGSVSLPIPSAPICDGKLYNGLAAVTDQQVVRNQVTAGTPLQVLNRINVDGSPIAYRSRIYPALRRDFAGMKMCRITRPEGLIPARLCYWTERTNQFVHFLDLRDSFDMSIFKIDCVLSPIVFADVMDVAMPKRPSDTQDMKAADAQQFYDDIISHFNSQQPPSIQWMAKDHLTGVQRVMEKGVFLEREASAFHVNEIRTRQFCLTEEMSQIGADLAQLEFPPLGVTEYIETIRVLVNDLGTGHPTSRGRNQRRDTTRVGNRARRSDRSARVAISRTFPTEDQTDDGPATNEEKRSQQDASDADLLDDSRATQQVLRRKKKKGAK